MWWKILSVLLLTGVILTGFLVPLNPNINRTSPDDGLTGRTQTVRFFGYNTEFTKNSADMRVWLTYKAEYALEGRNLRVENDTVFSAEFTFPRSLPRGEYFTLLDVLFDDPVNGKTELASAYKLLRDTSLSNAFDSLWTAAKPADLHTASRFRYANTPINYESIRNLFFHVPMWFVMIVLFGLSVWYSVTYLRRPDFQADLRAVIFAETGLLFGIFGLVTGMIWANYTWGRPWSNDIKQLMTAAALLVYAAYFILRASFDEPEKGARIGAVYNIFAFAALIPLIYVVPRVFESLHPGGENSPVFNKSDMNANMRMIFWPANLGWTLLGLWITQLRIRYKQLEARTLDLD